MITGPKWCGKTRTASEFTKSAIYFQDPDNRTKYDAISKTKPSKFLEGEKPRLLDEWQMYPIVWDSVRFHVDIEHSIGDFILTGSSTPIPEKEKEERKHTGTGRICEMRMRTMSLHESGESNGEVSLKDLFSGNLDVFSESDLGLEDIAFLICRGGWPESIGRDEDVSLNIASLYYETVVNEDVSKVDNVRRNSNTVDKLLRSVARNTSSQTPVSILCEDVRGDDYGGQIDVSDITLRSYMSALQRLYVIEDLEAWMPSMRAKARIRKTPKRNLADPSIAAAALRCRPDALLKDTTTLGLLFESLCIRDLRVYMQSLGGNVYFYRDETNYEVDAILDLGDGRWAAVEVKLNPDREDKAADNLKHILKKVDTAIMNEPSFMMVLTATGIAHRRDDGVLVVPIGCLRD